MENPGTILIVDDEPQGRETLEILLEPQGYQLQFADNGRESLSKASETVPDLILLDMMMPDMDGIEVCKRLRTDPTLAEVPIIMVTSLDDRDTKLKALEAGVDDFLTKPIDRMELRARVRTTTRLNRYRRLMTERAKFECISKEANDGFVMVDKELNITYANPKARIFLGIPPEEGPLSHLNFIVIAQQHYQPEPREAWNSWQAGDHRLTGNPCYLVRPESDDAEAFWLQVDLMELTNGFSDRRLIRLRDVSEQVSIHLDMARFHNFISHKIRTPLNGLMGCVDMIAASKGRMAPEELSELSHIGQTSAQRLDRDLQDILGFIDANQSADSPERFELKQFKDWLSGVAASCGLKEIRARIPEHLGERQLSIPKANLEVVFTEIFENAVKFHPQNAPTVVVDLKEVSGQRCCFRVADNGRSLSPQQLARAWTPYYQGEKNLTGEMKGMGLGLATAATIVWNAGGHCRIFNRIDGEPGIVIEFELPLQADTFSTPLSAS